MKQKKTVCDQCNAVIDAKAKVCPECGTKVKKPIYKKIWLWVIIVVVLLLIFVIIGGEDDSTDTNTDSGQQVEQQETAGSEETAEPEESQEPEETAEPEESQKPEETSDVFDEDDYTAIKYNKLARNPEEYTYRTIRGSGKVVQVIEGDENTQYRIAVGEDYDKIMFVEISNSELESRILEDDIVRYFGTFMGTITYESTLGGNITVPATLADKIIILQEAQ